MNLIHRLRDREVLVSGIPSPAGFRVFHVFTRNRSYLPYFPLSLKVGRPGTTVHRIRGFYDNIVPSAQASTAGVPEAMSWLPRISTLLASSSRIRPCVAAFCVLLRPVPPTFS